VNSDKQILKVSKQETEESVSNIGFPNLTNTSTVKRTQRVAQEKQISDDLLNV
jgi:hypothetical protein